MAQVDARVVVEVVSDNVDARLEPCAAECGVAGLLVQVVGREDEGFVGCEALRLVDRHGVAVVEVAGVESATTAEQIGTSDRRRAVGRPLVIAAQNAPVSRTLHAKSCAAAIAEATR